jgi:hypothetical protein
MFIGKYAEMPQESYPPAVAGIYIAEHLSVQDIGFLCYSIVHAYYMAVQETQWCMMVTEKF